MNLTNFYDHPGDNRYMVFRYYDMDYVEHFRQQLEQLNIEFEEHEEINEAGNQAYYFGVAKRNKEAAINANYLTYAAFRRNMIPNKFLRYGLVLFVLAMIILAIIGAIKLDL